MAHLRKRFLSVQLIKGLKFSPLVGILGHRQVGKTTLLEAHCQHYLTFDDVDTLGDARKDIKNFLRKNHALSTGIDECQILPSLFPSLKEVVRKDKRPGHYILSGSVRFTSRKAIRESLTGRIINFELLPFTISELAHLDLPQFLPKLLNSNSLTAFLQQISYDLQDRKHLLEKVPTYLVHGGLPGICFLRDAKQRKIRLTEQLATILDRDLRMVYPTTLPYSQILDYVKTLAQREGEMIRYAELERLVGISEATQKKLLYALEAVFLIRLIPSQAGKKGHILYFEDQAEVSQLAERKKTSLVDFEGLCYRHARAQFFYRIGESFRFFHFETRNNARVPFAVEADHGIIGFIPLENDSPTRSQIASAASFLKEFSNSKIIYLSRENTAQVIDTRSLILPVSVLA